MIETHVALHSSHGGDSAFHFRLVEDELFTPVLAYVSLLSVLQGHERAFGTATLHLDARLVLEGGHEVRLTDILAGDPPAPQAAALVAGPLGLLVGNDFEKVTVESLQIAVRAEEENRSARIARAWVDPAARLRPGGTAELKVALRTRRGSQITRAVPLTIPVSAPPGTYDLLVGDASTFDALEQQERRQPFAPRDLGQLLRSLDRIRAGNRVYARLSRPARGAIVAGEYLPALPDSVLSVLRSPEQGASVVPLGTTEIWSGSLDTDHAVSGARRLKITVER
jgi:hypothetical protein